MHGENIIEGNFISGVVGMNEVINALAHLVDTHVNFPQLHNLMKVGGHVKWIVIVVKHQYNTIDKIFDLIDDSLTNGGWKQVVDLRLQFNLDLLPSLDVTVRV